MEGTWSEKITKPSRSNGVTYLCFSIFCSIMQLIAVFDRRRFSLVQSHQPYLEMDFALRQEIYTNLEEKSVAYGLVNLTYPSFQRHYGFKCILSASDVVYSLVALLETSNDIAKKLGVQVGAAGYSASERWIWKDENQPFGGQSGFYLALDALSK